MRTQVARDFVREGGRFGDASDARRSGFGLGLEQGEPACGIERPARRHDPARGLQQPLLDCRSARRFAAAHAERAADIRIDVVARVHAFSGAPAGLKRSALGCRHVALIRPRAGEGQRGEATFRSAQGGEPPLPAGKLPRGTASDELRKSSRAPARRAFGPAADAARILVRANAASISAGECAPDRHPRIGRRTSKHWEGRRPCRCRRAPASEPRPSGPDRRRRKHGLPRRHKPDNGSCRRRSGCSAACSDQACRAGRCVHCRRAPRGRLAGRRDRRCAAVRSTESYRPTSPGRWRSVRARAEARRHLPASARSFRSR